MWLATLAAVLIMLSAVASGLAHGVRVVAAPAYTPVGCPS